MLFLMQYAFFDAVCVFLIQYAFFDAVCFFDVLFNILYNQQIVLLYQLWERVVGAFAAVGSEN